jgi:hypothetical protein
MSVDIDFSSLTSDQLKNKIEEIKWRNYRTNAQQCIAQFNVPRGRMSELMAIQKVISKGDKK